jgi:WD40 repeat protein
LAITYEPNFKHYCGDNTCRVAVTGCSDSVVRLWDTRSGVKVGKLKGHLDIVRGVRIMGDSSSMALVTAASDGVVCVWDARMQSHALTKTLPCHDDSIWALAVLPPSSGSTFIVTGSRNGYVALSNLTTGRSFPVGRCPFPIRKLLPVTPSSGNSLEGCMVYIAGDNSSVHSLTIPSISSFSSDGDDESARMEASAVCCEGREGLGAFGLMSDRMRVVCETTEGDVVLCSLLTGGILQRWAKVH